MDPESNERYVGKGEEEGGVSHACSGTSSLPQRLFQSWPACVCSCRYDWYETVALLHTDQVIHL